MIQTDIVERLRGCTDKKYPGFQNLNTEAADTITQLRLSNERMREACSTALTHVLELERAWMRGVIDERDDGGGTRSNRNVEVRNALQTALTAESGTEVEG